MLNCPRVPPRVGCLCEALWKQGAPRTNGAHTRTIDALDISRRAANAAISPHNDASKALQEGADTTRSIVRRMAHLMSRVDMQRLPCSGLKLLPAIPLASFFLAGSSKKVELYFLSKLASTRAVCCARRGEGDLVAPCVEQQVCSLTSALRTRTLGAGCRP